MSRKRAKPTPRLDHHPVTDRLGIGSAHGERGSIGGDVAFIRLDGGGMLMLPTAVRRLDDEGLDLVAHLQSVVARISEDQYHLDGLVAAAREGGLSWAVIGWSVGTTGEAARQRWGMAS